MKTPKKLIMTIFFLLSTVTLFMSCVTNDNKLEKIDYGEIKIHIVDEKTKAGLQNIKITHCICFSVYDWPFDWYANADYQIIAGEYFTDINGYVIIEKTKIKRNKYFEEEFFTNEIFIINYESENKKVEQNIVVLNTQNNKYNIFERKYKLLPQDYLTFKKSNDNYQPEIYDFFYYYNPVDENTNYKELINQYENIGIKYQIIKYSEKNDIYIEL
ncbi:MAG: hypothetical protein GXX85_06980 [Ignavibacteria bacterium]|nr:hypothetical protein [Ignavibacteria bacterium]